MKHRALLIPADPTIPVRLVDVPDADALRDHVGGWLEAAPGVGADQTLWVNEEGHLRGLPANPRATALWSRLVGRRLGPEPLRGNAVLSGCDQEGCDVDVSLADLDEALDVVAPGTREQVLADL